MHLVPHVAIGGTTSSEGHSGFTFKEVAGDEGSSSPRGAATRLVSRLVAHSTASGPWLPGGQRLRIDAVGGLDLPKKTVPSILSPKNCESELFPDKVFTSKWIEKYTLQVPTTVVLFAELGPQLEQDLNELRLAVRAARSHILVIAVAEPETDLNARLALLRRNTGLAPKTELVCLRTDASEGELEALESQIWPLLQAQAADFFAARSRETRHKRAQNDGQDMALWEARYTLKLAFFAEFKADFDGAIRLYQSAYECLQSLGPRGAEWLDLVAQKIWLFLLYYQRYNSAYAKFRFHLAHGAGGGSTGPSRDWEATQYLSFASTLAKSVVEKWAVSPDSSDPLVAAPRPGFLALSAAKLAADPNLKKEAFDFALHDLGGFPNCRATVLRAVADWKAQSGDGVDELEEALRALPPLSQRFEAFSDARVPLGKFYKYLRGEGEPPAGPLGAINKPLFEVRGCFVSDTAFVGKPLKCQLSFAPRFTKPLEAAIKAQFNCASHTLRHTFEGPQTFTFDIKPSETGECEFVDVQVSFPQFGAEQRLLVGAADAVWTPEGPRHKHVVAQKTIEVHARPQLLGVDTAEVPAVLYSEEQTSLKIGLVNKEHEEARVSVKVAVGGPVGAESSSGGTTLYTGEHTIEAGHTKTIPFDLRTPPSPFSLSVTTTYTTPSNEVPVSNTTTADVQVLKPFQAHFSLSPKLHTEAWPNLFVPSDQCGPLPLIRRRWTLGAKIVSMCEDEISIVARSFVCSSTQASITALSPRLAVDASLNYNESLQTEVNFEAMRKDRDLRSFEAEGELVIEWRRAGSNRTSSYAVPRVRVSLPNQEPRVLLDVHNDGNTGRIELEYFVENATSHTLNFAISMGSSRYFSFHGPKATTARVLPFSRHRLNYVLFPVCDPVNKQLPELRVFDTTYKKVLPVLSDSGSVYTEGTKLFLRTFSPPL